MNIAFRVDATNQIGTGHLMRCLALAEGLRIEGVRIRFISRNLPSYLSRMILSRNFEYTALIIDVESQAYPDELPHAKWLGTSQTQDAYASIQALRGIFWDWIIVDHYALDRRWELKLRDFTEKIMVIDDLADRYHECDVLLDQNLYQDMDIRYCKKVPDNCLLLLGPNFALLRDEFRELRPLAKPRKEEVKKILIFFGGVDLANYTSIAIEALGNLGVGEIVDVVIGDQHPYALSIKNACIKRGYRCHIQTTEMAKLMIDADLAVGAGGSASWERCCLGLPTILVAVSENQINIAAALNLVGACLYVGSKEYIGLDEIQFAIKKILDSPESIVKMSNKAMSLVDGLGVTRASKVLGIRA